MADKLPVGCPYESAGPDRLLEAVTVAAFLGAEIDHLAVYAARNARRRRYVGPADGIFLEFAAGLSGRLPGRARRPASVG